jgi:hypothetical protein
MVPAAFGASGWLGIAAVWCLACSLWLTVRKGCCMRNTLRKARFPLMAPGLMALLTALCGGLIRLGWGWPLLHEE